MAGADGGRVSNWWCHVEAYQISETDTTAVIRVESRFYSDPWGYSVSNGNTARCYCDGQDTGYGAVGGVNVSYGVAARLTMRTFDFTVGKTDSARNVWCVAGFHLGGYQVGTSEAGVNVTIGGIRYKTPNPPKNVTFAVESDTKASMTWQANYDNNALKPWKQLLLDQRRSVNGEAWGSWSNAKTMNWDALNSSVTDLKPNGRYQFALYARNGAGDSSHVDSQILYTTPAAPKSVSAAKTSTSQVTVTADVSNTYAHRVKVERSVGGGTWTTVGEGTVSNGVGTFVDKNAPAGVVSYRVSCTRPAYGDDTGLTVWTGAAVESNTVTTITAPLAPTVVEPASGAVHANPWAGVVSWNPNHPDGSAQTSAQVEITNPYGTVTTRSVYDDTASLAYTFAQNGTWSVRIRTKGLHADWGAWSSPRSFTVATAPSVVLTSPGDVIEKVPFDVSWSVADTTGVSEQTVTIFVDGVERYSEKVDAGLRTVSVGSSKLLPVNHSTLTIQVTVKGGSTLTATQSIVATVDYTPPADPYLTFEPDEDMVTGSAVVSVTFGTPGYGQPDTEYVSVYRVLDGEELLLAERLYDGQQVEDVLPPLNVSYAYRCVAHASSGAVSEFTQSVVYESHFSMLNFESDASRFVALGWDEKVTRKVEHVTSEFHFARGDSPRPVSYGLSQLDTSITVDGWLEWDQNVYASLVRLFDAYTYGWFREGSGLRMYGKIAGSLSVDTAENRKIAYSLEVTVLDWMEPNR